MKKLIKIKLCAQNGFNHSEIKYVTNWGPGRSTNKFKEKNGQETQTG